MERAIRETERRRIAQAEYNTLHNITPTGVFKAVHDVMEGAYSPSSPRGKLFPKGKKGEDLAQYAMMSQEVLVDRIKKLETKMYEHAHQLEFEEASRVRDLIRQVKDFLL